MNGVYGNYSLSIAIDGTSIPTNRENIKNLYMIESIENLIPVLHIDYLDTNNIFDSTFPLIGDEVLTIQFGRASLEKLSFNEDFISSMRFFIHSFTVTQETGSGIFLYSIDCVHEAYEKMFTTAYTRAFKNMTSAEVFSALMAEMGVEYSIGNLESTNDRQTWIQSGWNNATMLKHLVKNSRVQLDRSGVMCFCDRKNRFSFCTYDTMAIKLPTQFLMTSPLSFPGAIQIVDLKTENDALNSYITGASGGSTMYFDWQNKKFVTEGITLFDCNRFEALKDLMIRSQRINKDTYYYYYGCQNPNSYDGRQRTPVKDKVARSMNNIQKVSCATDILTNSVPGDVVLVQYNMEKELTIDSLYRGLWVVHSVITGVSDVALRKYVLIRSGVDIPKTKKLATNLIGKNLTGFITDTAGRIVRKAINTIT